MVLSSHPGRPVALGPWGMGAAPVSGPLSSSLENLSLEGDSGIFWSDLLTLAQENRRAYPQQSAQILNLFQQNGFPENFQPSAELSHRAQELLNGMRGRGEVGPQLEYFAEGFLEDVTHPSMLLGMTAASLVGSLTRLGILSKIHRLGPSHWLARTPLVNLATSGGGLLLETPAFYIASHSAEAMLNPQTRFLDFSEAGPQMASMLAMLGLLKVGGSFFRGIVNLGYDAPILSRGTTLPRGMPQLTARLAENLGMVSGLTGYFQVGPSLGISPATSDQHPLLLSLLTLAQFQTAGIFARGLMGPRLNRQLFQSEYSQERLWHDLNNRQGPGYGTQVVTPEGMTLNTLPDRPLESPLENPSMYMKGRPKSGHAKINVKKLLTDPQAAAESLPMLSPRQLEQVVKGYEKNGQLLQLMIAREALLGGREQTTREALDRLKTLEEGVEAYVSQKNSELTPEGRARAVRNWVREMTHNPQEGIAGLFTHMKKLKLGIGEKVNFLDMLNLVGNTTDFMSRVTRRAPWRRAYTDLALIREYLISEGYVYHMAEEGLLLGDYLRTGHGNCVHKCLLFSHMARRMGHELQWGSVPRHVFLEGKAGGAIETTHRFALLHRNVYYRPEHYPEAEPRPPYQGAGFHLIHVGLRALHAKDFPMAEQSFALAEKLLPGHSTPHFHWAKYYLHRSNVPMATEAMLRFYENSGKNPEAMRKAISVLEKLNDHSPEAPMPYFALAKLYRHLGETDRATRLEFLGELMKNSD